MPKPSAENNDVDSAEHWLAEHGDKLYGYALARVGGDGPAAEDLVQETLLAGLKAQASFRGESRVETWLVGILRRKIIDRYRAEQRKDKQKKVANSGLEGVIFDSHGSLVDVTDWGEHAGDQLDSAEFRKVFDSCLADLNPVYAEAFTICVMDGLSTEEACSMLGITPTNLSVRLHRARVTLRKLLQSRWFEGA